MLAPVAEAIAAKNGARTQTYTLPYMARAFDNGHTYADSKADAVSKASAVLKTYADKCHGAKITITGNSQGADAAGDIAAAIGNDRGPIDADRVLGVGLLADPGAGTKGSATVGSKTSGEGISGPRSQGMGTLSGRVASICDPTDLYCSIQKGANPFLGSLGSILSKTLSNTSDTAAGGSAAVATALTSDFTHANLPGLESNVATLDRQPERNGHRRGSRRKPGRRHRNLTVEDPRSPGRSAAVRGRERRRNPRPGSSPSRNTGKRSSTGPHDRRAPWTSPER